MRFFILLACALFAGPAHADLSFVQVVQAQSDRGHDGLFGKSWVAMKGGRMRVVSGYARKLLSEGETVGPRRVVQIVDLRQRTRLLLKPEEKTYSRQPLADLDYGNRMLGVLSRGSKRWRIADAKITLKKDSYTRKMLGTDCSHYRLTATFALVEPGGRTGEARMDQHVWVAPISGDLAAGLMDLIAFENRYREATRGSLSPLDHERYQIREAAAYLRVGESELRDAVERVRERLRELPSYPVASSVSWWRAPGPGEPGPRREKRVETPPSRQQEPGVSVGQLKPRRPRGKDRMREPTRAARWERRPRKRANPRFRPIDWRKTEGKINGLYSRTRREFGRFPLGRMPSKDRTPARRVKRSRPREEAVVSSVYPRFEAELRRILVELIEAEDRLIEMELAGGGKKGAKPEKGKDAEAPFYEIYAELHGLDGTAAVDAEAFRIPYGYHEAPD